MIYQIISYLKIIFYSFLYNIPFISLTVNTPSIETEFYLYNNFVTSLFFILGVIFLDYLLILLGKFIYKKNKINLSKYNILNIYILAFIIRFIPILSHIGSIIMGMNNINIKKIIKIYLLGYIFFLGVGYLIVRYNLLYFYY